jgi:hypothetical protein
MARKQSGFDAIVVGSSGLPSDDAEFQMRRQRNLDDAKEAMRRENEERLKRWYAAS